MFSGGSKMNIGKKEVKAVNMFMKEQLYLLKEAQKDKSHHEEHSHKSTELAQFLLLYNFYLCFFP